MPSWLRQILGGPQLPVGGPLHEFDEFDLARPHPGAGGAFGVVRLPPLFRPFHGLPNLCRSTSKQAKRDSSGAALGAEFVKILGGPLRLP